jgi:hypothetical protein
MTSKDVFKAVMRTQPGAIESTVRNELSNMVSDPDFPVVSVRRGLYALKSVAFDHEVHLVSDSLRNLLTGISAAGISITPDGYQSPAFALLDCIFSARAQYSSVIALIDRVSKKLGYTDADEVGIREFVDLVEVQAHGVEDIPYWLANIFFENRSYSAKDLTKAVQVFIVAKRLLTLAETNSVLWNLDKKIDFDRISLLNSDDAAEFLSAFEIEMTRLRGWGPALHRYLLLLLNVSQVSKPDTRIIEFIARSLGRSAASIEARHAAFIFEDAVRILNEEGLPYSVIEADHACWLFISGRISVPLETTFRPNEEGELRPSAPKNASQIVSDSPNLKIGDHVTSKSGSPTRIGEIVGTDPSDALRFIVVWPEDNGGQTFGIELQSSLRYFGSQDGDHFVSSPSDDKFLEGGEINEFLTEMINAIDTDTARRHHAHSASQTANGALDNHSKLDLALAPHRGQTLSTQQIWEIVYSKWHGAFAKGSFLPNDHASGNKGSCWCARNRQNRPLFEKISRGFYRVL